MAYLKEDGRLDVDRINNFPIDEFMDVFCTLTKEQVKEFTSALPIKESQEPIKTIEINYSMEDDIQRNDAVLLEDLISKIRKKYGIIA